MHSAVFLSLSKDAVVPEVISTHVDVFFKVTLCVHVACSNQNLSKFAVLCGNAAGPLFRMECC